MVFISGQVGIGRDGVVPSGAFEQTTLALANVEALLDSAGIGPQSLVRLLTFVSGDADLTDFYRARDEVHERWFGAGPPPGHSLAVTAGLARPDLLVEVEGWAVVTSPVVEDGQ